MRSGQIATMINSDLSTPLDVALDIQTLTQNITAASINAVFRNSTGLGLALDKAFGINSAALRSVKTLYELVDSSEAMEAVAANTLASDAFVTSSLVTIETAVTSSAAMTAVLNNSVLRESFFLSSYVGQGLDTYGGINNTTLKGLTTMAAVAANSTAMAAVAASSTVMSKIAVSGTAMSVIAASTVAMNAIIANTVAFNIIITTSAALSKVVTSATAMARVAASSTAMASIIANTSALTSALTNSASLNAIAANSISRTAIEASTAAINILNARSVITYTGQVSYATMVSGYCWVNQVRAGHATGGSVDPAWIAVTWSGILTGSVVTGADSTVITVNKFASNLAWSHASLGGRTITSTQTSQAYAKHYKW